MRLRFVNRSATIVNFRIKFERGGHSENRTRNNSLTSKKTVYTVSQEIALFEYTEKIVSFFFCGDTLRENVEFHV